MWGMANWTRGVACAVVLCGLLLPGLLAELVTFHLRGDCRTLSQITMMTLDFWDHEVPYKISFPAKGSISVEVPLHLNLSQLVQITFKVDQGGPQYQFNLEQGQVNTVVHQKSLHLDLAKAFQS